MKYLLYISSLFSIYSCSVKKCDTGLHKIEIANVGIIEICLTPEFDTEYTTIQFPDYGCQFINKGFISSKQHNLPILDTVHYMWKYDSVPDPLKIHSFNVSFYKERKCDRNPAIDQKRLVEIEKIRMIENYTTQILIKKLEKIDELEFLLFGYRTINDSNCFETLHAETKIDSTEITILFQKQSQDTTSFVNDMYMVLRTIRKK